MNLTGTEMKIKRDKEGKFAKEGIGLKVVAIIFALAGLLAGVDYLISWGATHQLQKPWYFNVNAGWKPLIVQVNNEPTKVYIPVVKEATEFTSTEQAVIDVWGYKDGVIALAIFDCGESGLDPEAVSHTGDLGIAQINWATWRTQVEDKFGYTAKDMFDVTKNLEVAYWVWDRADGVEGNGEGGWEPWSGYNNGSYTLCFQ